MPLLFLEPRLHPSIVKFFALIRLHVERSPRRGLLVNAFQSTYHVLAAFGFDGDGPGILGQDIDHGQQIFVPLIPSTEFLHVHQIHLPLFVSVKDQRGSGGEPRPSGFVEDITQHRLENPLRLRGFQFLGFGKGLDPTQGPGFLGIFVSEWQRHDNTDTTSFPFSFFNSFFTHLHDFFCFKTRLCYQSFHSNGASSPSPSPGLQPIPQTDSTTAFHSPFARLRLIETRTQRRVPSHRATPGVGGHRCDRLSQFPNSAFFRRGAGSL